VRKGSNVARRYAAGAFLVAQEGNEIDVWRGEMAKLDELLSDEVLTAAFKNPAVSMERRMELARRLAPELKPEAANLLRLLIEHQRTQEMPAIREEFERLADEAAGIVHAVLTTAVELSEQERRAYQQALAGKLGKDVRLRHETDAGLVGGATIQIGDHLVDGSVRTQLERLRQDLLG
jgi:F-type H+-transporting ATPase subunit delta